MINIPDINLEAHHLFFIGNNFLMIEEIKKKIYSVRQYVIDLRTFQIITNKINDGEETCDEL